MQMKVICRIIDLFCSALLLMPSAINPNYEGCRVRWRIHWQHNGSSAPHNKSTVVKGTDKIFILIWRKLRREKRTHRPRKSATELGTGHNIFNFSVTLGCCFERYMTQKNLVEESYHGNWSEKRETRFQMLWESSKTRGNTAVSWNGRVDHILFVTVYLLQFLDLRWQQTAKHLYW